MIVRHDNLAVISTITFWSRDGGVVVRISKRDGKMLQHWIAPGDLLKSIAILLEHPDRLPAWHGPDDRWAAQDKTEGTTP